MLLHFFMDENIHRFEGVVVFFWSIIVFLSAHNPNELRTGFLWRCIGELYISGNLSSSALNSGSFGTAWEMRKGICGDKRSFAIVLFWIGRLNSTNFSWTVFFWCTFCSVGVAIIYVIFFLRIMERLEEKIREAEDFRDRFFLDHPEIKDPNEKGKAVREMVLPLLQVFYHFFTVLLICFQKLFVLLLCFVFRSFSHCAVI